MPAAQLVHALAPGAEYFPTAQFEHAVEATEPVAALNVPPAQSAHWAFPVVDAYAPATHTVHDAAAPLVEVRPVAQALQATAPVVAL